MTNGSDLGLMVFWYVILHKVILHTVKILMNEPIVTNNLYRVK